jgi:Catalase
MTTMQPRPTTTDAGIPVASDQLSLTVGPDGPILLHDAYLIEQMANFNRERIPERQPHAKGHGAAARLRVLEERRPRPRRTRREGRPRRAVLTGGPSMPSGGPAPIGAGPLSSHPCSAPPISPEVVRICEEVVRPRVVTEVGRPELWNRTNSRPVHGELNARDHRRNHVS